MRYRLFPPLPNTLETLAATIIAGTSSTKTKVSAVTGNTLGELMYKVGAGLTLPTLGEAATGYTALTLNTDLACVAGNKIVVAEVFQDKIYGADLDDVVVA